MFILVTGKIASGKTTLCETLESLLPNSIKHIAPGKLMRQHIQAHSPLGRRIETLLVQNKGLAFLPRDIVPSIMMESIYEDPSLGMGPKILLLDGFPACRPDWDVFLNLQDHNTKTKNLYPFLHLQLHAEENQRSMQFHRRMHLTSRTDDSLSAYENRSALASAEQPYLNHTLVKDGLTPAHIPSSVTKLLDRVKFTLTMLHHHISILDTDVPGGPPCRALTLLTQDILMALQRLSDLSAPQQFTTTALQELSKLPPLRLDYDYTPSLSRLYSFHL